MASREERRSLHHDRLDSEVPGLEVMLENRVSRAINDGSHGTNVSQSDLSRLHQFVVGVGHLLASPPDSERMEPAACREAMEGIRRNAVLDDKTRSGLKRKLSNIENICEDALAGFPFYPRIELNPAYQQGVEDTMEHYGISPDSEPTIEGERVEGWVWGSEVTPMRDDQEVTFYAPAHSLIKDNETRSGFWKRATLIIHGEKP